MISLSLSWCFSIDRSDGYTRVLMSGVPSLCWVALWYFVGNCFIVNPRKSKPAWPSSLLLPSSVWAILVFSFFSSSPIVFSHSCNAFRHNLITSSLECITTRSSAYLITASDDFLSRFDMTVPLGYLVGSFSTRPLRCSSIPCSAMFARSGEITPPCGVPASVSSNTSPLRTPAFNQPFI